MSQSTNGTRAGHRFVAAAVAGVVAIAPLALPSLGGVASAGAARGFEYLGQLSVSQEGGDSNQEGALLMDPVHRRAYAFDRSNTDTIFRVFDLDTFAELPRMLITTDQVGLTGTTPETVGQEPVMTNDPDSGRIFFVSLGNVFAVDTLTYNPTSGAPVVRLWIGTPPLEEVDSALGVQGVGTIAGAANQVLNTMGMSYDKGGAGDAAGAPHPERLFMVHEVVDGNENGAIQSNQKGVILSAWDARPGGGSHQNPEQRREWLYSFRSCGSSGQSPSLNTSNAANMLPVVRLGDWVYAYCDAFDDANTHGLVRVRLDVAQGGRPAPNPETEQFFPGVSGTNPNVAWDAVTRRLYVTTVNLRAGSRSVLVFDHNVGDEDGGAGQGVASYIGEIALSQSPQHTADAVDPSTGRWFFRSVDGLWYQDGRLRRVAQANLFKRDTAGSELSNIESKKPEGDSPVLPRRLYVDPATPDRGARVLVWRFKTDKDEAGNLQCLTPGVFGCYEVFEDLSSQPSSFSVPNERTLNEPEGPGKVGVYAGVAGAYGVQIGLIRGLSGLWPNGNGFLPIDGPRPSPPSPSQPSDYLTDPFFTHGGNCGSQDRRLMLGRVLDTRLDGGLFNQGAAGAAVAVDPEVHRPSAADDTRTRYDFNNPDDCTERLLRTLGGEDVGENPPTVDPETDRWPYDTTRCAGDASPEEVSGALAPSGAPVLPGTAKVTCGATASPSSVEARAATQLAPGGGIVAVGSTESSTKITRVPGSGIRSEATAIVRDVTVAGAVHLDQIVVRTSAEAGGYATAEGTTARVVTTREFLGLAVGGAPQCAVCSTREVVDALNKALGGLGYARAAEPERDVTLGTTKGTLAIAQKDLLLQDADATTNRDYTAEWPGLEIVVYRDSVQRGRGRWTVQLGGAFAQAQFGVVNALSALSRPDFRELRVGAAGIEPRAPVPGAVTGGEPDLYYSTTPPPEAETAAASRPAPEPDRGVLRQIREAIARAIGAAFVMLALWTLVFGPVYVSRRRRLLNQVTAA